MHLRLGENILTLIAATATVIWRAFAAAALLVAARSSSPERPLVLARRGRAGPAGATGASGPTGPTGPTGLTGATGPLGTDILTYPLNGGGVQLATGVQRIDLTVPFNCTITSWDLLADQSGSLVVDIWKDTYTNFPPTDADSITASAPPTISGATKAQSATLTGWTTSLSQGDILRMNVDSATAITYALLALHVTRT